MKNISILLLISGIIFSSWFFSALANNKKLTNEEKKQIFIEKYGKTCDTATDWVNDFWWENFSISTRVWYPENFEAKWSCVLEKNKIKENIKICTAHYDPVCGIDWITYWNSCAASVKIAHKWACEDNFSNGKIKKFLWENETKKIENAVKNFKNTLKNMKESEKEKKLDKIDDNIEKAINKILSGKNENDLKWNDLFKYNVIIYLKNLLDL